MSDWDGIKQDKGTFHNYHRFESRCYETASSFQTVWGPLTQQANTQKMGNIAVRHLYFLSKILQDSLLTRQLNQAVAAMIGLSGKCEKVVELFCLAGLEILKNIPHNHMVILNFYKNMFLACADHQQEILLNFALYLVLKKRDVVEGLELLKSKSSKPKFNQSLMHKAYIALLEYLLHLPEKNESSAMQDLGFSDSEEEHDTIFEQALPTKTNWHFTLKRSSALFEEVFSNPGVWDSFFPAYVGIVKSSKGVSGVQKLLEDYRERNPLNPNAQRYLYNFMKSNSASDDEMMAVLQDLVKLDPTSEYLEDLVGLKVKFGDPASAVRMLFEKLDHSGYMFDEKTWARLDSYLNAGCVKLERELKREAQLCWEERRSWWTKYHFRVTKSFKFSDDLRTVMLCKARVAEYFLGPGNDFTEEIYSKYEIAATNRSEVKEMTDKSTPQKRKMSDSTHTSVKRSKRAKR